MAIRVWLPEPDSVELMGGLPAGMTADVWTGGEQLPDSADQVEVVVLPFGVPPTALPKAGIVILLVPITPATTGMVDARFLSQMHDHALLVNAARGSIVDTGALLAELRSGRLRAALDVTDPEPLPAGHPLWSAPGLLLTPHVAGAMTTAVPRVMTLVRDQLARYAAGEPLLNIVGEQGY